MTMGCKERPVARIVLILWNNLQNGNDKTDRRKSNLSPGGVPIRYSLPKTLQEPRHRSGINEEVATQAGAIFFERAHAALIILLCYRAMLRQQSSSSASFLQGMGGAD